MRIGLISDTHIPSFSPEPPWQVLEAFRGVDLILHAGDIYATSCLDWLEQIAPVLAVEFGGPHGSDPRVQEKRVFEAGGYTIAMVHALSLARLSAEPRRDTIPNAFPQEGSLARAVKSVFAQHADIVVYGHTHQEMIDDHQGILLVNPGSPTLPRHRHQLGTVGILELTPQGRTARIIDLAALP
jgi:putative phosphoesterase